MTETTIAAPPAELRPTLVRASAGTGKTYKLTARFLRILLQGSAPETILATTFTRKAAGEILERVLLTLAKAADPDHPESLAELRKQVDLPGLPQSLCLEKTALLLRNIHRVRISTLDSLFSQLARSFAFELGLPPGWRLTDEIEEVWLRERAVDSVIASLDPSELTALLSMLGKGEVKRSIARELSQVVEEAFSVQRLCGCESVEEIDRAETTRCTGDHSRGRPDANGPDVAKTSPGKACENGRHVGRERLRGACRGYRDRERRRGTSEPGRSAVLQQAVSRRCRRSV